MSLFNKRELLASAVRNRAYASAYETVLEAANAKDSTNPVILFAAFKELRMTTIDASQELMVSAGLSDIGINIQICHQVKVTQT